MKTIDANNIFQAILKIQQDARVAPVKFGYALAINNKRLKDVVESFEASRTELIKRYGQLDENGEPKVENNMYVMADMASFEREMTELQLSEVDVKLQQVDLDSLPTEIEPIILQILLPMIKDAD